MRLCTGFLLVAVAPLLRADCVTFPANLIPFSSVSYVTAANSSGDQLVVGALAGGPNAISPLPLPASTNQVFCDATVQLAFGQFYSNVYVPTTQEISGNFSAFAGLLVDPATGLAFPNGVIPAGRLGSVYGFRIGAAQVTSAIRSWSPTGSMTQQRASQAAVLLPSGKVLVAGPPNSAELYDPTSGTFTSTGQMRFAHGALLTATLMNDGRVLIVGGINSPSAAELYDPASGQFQATGTPVQPHGYFHSATLLNDGRVLIVGGLIAPGNGGTAADTNAGAEVYDPKTGLFAKTGIMADNRNLHTATLLADGRVLITGGNLRGSSAPNNNTFNSAEIFNPATGTFSIAAFMNQARSAHFAVLLSDGTVLVGGGDSNGGSAEVFDPVLSIFTSTGAMNNPSRAVANATLLTNGQALINGGKSPANVVTNCAELYNPATGTFQTGGNMGTPRVYAAATALLDGKVLVTGGSTGPNGLSSAELYTPVTQGLVTSQTGLTFHAAQGSSLVASQNVVVLSPTDTIPWSVSIRTYQGGGWLSVTPTSGSSSPTTPVPISITVDPTGLGPQDYYGAVTLTPTDQKHAPVTIAVVLNIVPAGTSAPLQVAPTGLVFLGTAGSSPKLQSFTISNFTSSAINFTATSSGTWFTFAPVANTITKVLPANITVTPASSALTAGVYRGSIKLSFSDSSTQTVDLLLVVSPAPKSGSVAEPDISRRFAAPSTCTPSKLLPVLTSIAAGSTAPVAWPTLVSVQVVDDCSNSFNTGSVIASFTNGDPPISLTAIGGGTWTGTWTPQRTTANSTVRADARLLQPAISGSVQVAVQVATNPKVPNVATGGIVSSGDFSSPPAAGLLVSIFGSALADGSAGFNSAPVPTQLGSTQVLLGGVDLPLVYVSENQVNVLIPFETPLNVPLSLLVQRNNAISVPVTTAVFAAQPAILSNGLGQGDIFGAGGQTLADANAPAAAGDVLVIYAVGLGAVTPPVPTGTGSPSSPLAKVSAPTIVTIGGQSVQPVFAGLTPGFVGLYQLNVVMPAGVTAGSQVPVTVSVGGKTSASGIFMAVK
jgi:uncharacterized protein (TIGR03437 family)